MSKYKDLIFPDEKKIEAEVKKTAVEDAKMDVMNDIHGAKKVVSQATKNAIAARRATGTAFSTKAILTADMALEDANDNLERLEALYKELF